MTASHGSIAPEVTSYPNKPHARPRGTRPPVTDVAIRLSSNCRCQTRCAYRALLPEQAPSCCAVGPISSMGHRDRCYRQCHPAYVGSNCTSHEATGQHSNARRSNACNGSSSNAHRRFEYIANGAIRFHRYEYTYYAIRSQIYETINRNA